MKKLKEIIVLYPSYERGGATHNLINFINFCLKRNIKLIFISNIKKKDIFFKRKKNNIRLISLNNKLLSKFKGRFITSLNSIIQLSILLNQNNNKDSIVFSFQSHILEAFQRKVASWGLQSPWLWRLPRIGLGRASLQRRCTKGTRLRLCFDAGLLI